MIRNWWCSFIMCSYETVFWLPSFCLLLWRWGWPVNDWNVSSCLLYTCETAYYNTDRTALVQWANTTHYRPGPEQSAAPDRQIVATAKRCPLPLPCLPGNLDVGSIVAPPGLSASPCAHSSSLVTIVSLGCSVCLWLVFLWQRRNCYHSHTRL